MRRDVQEIFRSTPHEKQVMMFSATLSKEIRPVCKKFMQDVITSNQFFTTFNQICLPAHSYALSSMPKPPFPYTQNPQTHSKITRYEE